MRWVGVDVGGARKGFDVAVLEGDRLLSLRGRQSCDAVVALVEEVEPAVVAIDSPRSCAPPGQKLRECERRIAHEVCGIRWTPDSSAVQSNPYYAWVVRGLELYAKLAGFPVIEVFPTASWTRWIGKPGAQSRAMWTRRALMTLGLAGVPVRTNQDQRDAIAAAVTARQHTLGTTEAIGEIVVPRSP